MAGGFYNNSGSDLLTFLRPRQNWNQRAQAKQAELQYSNILESRARQDAQESQAAVEAQMSTINQFKALPFEEPDKLKVDGLVDSLLGGVLKKIEKDYAGDARKYFQTEGRIGLQQLKDQFVSSPLYTQAESNKVQMDQIRKAMADGKEIIGEYDPNTKKYVTAQQRILDYRNGLSDRVNFNGAYDPSKLDPMKYFGDQYAPGGSKFEVRKVSEEDKLAYATGHLPGAAAIDYFNKNLAKRNYNYKSDPIENKQLFDLELKETKSKIAEKYSQINRNNAAAEKDRRPEASTAEAIPATYYDRALNTPLGSRTVSTFNPTSATNNEVIPQLGIKVGDIATTNGGKKSIVFHQISNQEGDERALETIGIQKKTVNGKNTYSGQLPGILSETGTVGYINLKGLPDHRIISSDSYMYLDGQQSNKLATGGAKRPDYAWKKFKIGYTEKDLEDIDTPEAKKIKALPLVKVKTDGTMGYIIEGGTPVDNYYKDPLIDQTITKGLGGQKQSNEIFNAPTPASPVFNWRN